MAAPNTRRSTPMACSAICPSEASSEAWHEMNQTAARDFFHFTPFSSQLQLGHH
jgi:hypothetical protein